MAEKYEKVANYNGDDLEEPVNVWRTHSEGGHALYFTSKASRELDESATLLPEETAIVLKIESESSTGDVIDMRLEGYEDEGNIFKSREREQRRVKVAMLAYAAFAALSIRQPETIVTATAIPLKEQRELREVLGLRQDRKKSRQDAAIFDGPVRRTATIAADVLKDNDVYAAGIPQYQKHYPDISEA